MLQAVRATRELRPFLRLAGEAANEADHHAKKDELASSRGTGRRHQDKISCQVILEKTH